MDKAGLSDQDSTFVFSSGTVSCSAAQELTALELTALELTAGNLKQCEHSWHDKMNMMKNDILGSKAFGTRMKLGAVWLQTVSSVWSSTHRLSRVCQKRYGQDYEDGT